MTKLSDIDIIKRVFYTYIFLWMELNELIMDSHVLSANKKLELINAIKKQQLDQDKINEITQFLIKNKNDIDNATNEYVDAMKNEYNGYLSKKIPELKRNVSMLKLRTDEILSKETEWDPDDILNLIQ